MTDLLRHTHMDTPGDQKLTHSHPGGQYAHGYFQHPIPHAGVYPRREDGSVPDPGSATRELASGLPVFTDDTGCRWIKVADDGYIPLNGQLLRAITDKWRVAPLAQISAAGLTLTPMAPAS
jgi:hypothetical protein